MTRKHFEVVRHLMQNARVGLLPVRRDRRRPDPSRLLEVPRSAAPPAPARQPVRTAPCAITTGYLDEEIGEVLELLDDDTIVLVVSDHGAQRLDGGFCVNEWLVREGLLVLQSAPAGAHAAHARPESTGPHQGVERGRLLRPRVLQRRGPRAAGHRRAGASTSAVRDEMHGRLERSVDDRGEPMGTLVFRPEELYQTVRNVAARSDRRTSARCTGARSAASATTRCTSRRTTPVRTTATTPSSACSSWRRRHCRCAASSRGRAHPGRGADAPRPGQYPGAHRDAGRSLLSRPRSQAIRHIF